MHRIQVLRYSEGAHLRTIGSRGSGNGQFQSPLGIAFDGAGHLVVAEYGNHRVQVLRYSDGAHVRTIGSGGSGNGQFANPYDLAVDCDGPIAQHLTLDAPGVPGFVESSLSVFSTVGGKKTNLLHALPAIHRRKKRIRDLLQSIVWAASNTIEINDYNLETCCCQP
jgi:DNA-binding beta-propeller fold protein YncE